MKLRKISFILIPLFTGVIIYLLYRSRNLFYYKLLAERDVYDYLGLLRAAAKDYRHYLNTWMVYSLPDGLWLFSFGAALLLERKYYWLHVGIFTSIFVYMLLLEGVQALFGGHGHWLGTCDMHDIEAYSIAFLSVLVLSFFLRRKEEEPEKSRQTECWEDLGYLAIFAGLALLPSLL